MATPKHFIDLDQVDPKTRSQILDHGKEMKKQRANGATAEVVGEEKSAAPAKAKGKTAGKAKKPAAKK